MVLNLLNLYALIFALFDKISQMSETSVCLQKDMMNATKNGPTISPTTKVLENATDSYGIFTTDSYGGSLLSSTLPDITTVIVENTTRCYEIVVSCITPTSFNQTWITSMILLNLTSTMLPENMTRSSNETFVNYDDFGSFNSTNMLDEFDYLFDNNRTGVLFNHWIGNKTVEFSNVTMNDANRTRRFKREDDYEYDYDEVDGEYENSYNPLSEFGANLQDGMDFTTISDGNMSDIYATISTILDNITTTSWADKNFSDYERKCVG